jgi:competence protein ComEA
MDLPALTPSHRRLIAVGLLIVVGLFVLAPRVFQRGASRHVVVPLRTAAAARRVEARIVVDVAGAVRRPGLYRLPSGTRIADAVAIAGGATRKANLTLVNLAAPLADGEQVVVPAGAAGAGAAAGAPSPTAPLDLNTATAEQLDALPGIGPATAQKIVDYRQAHGAFHSVDELDGVSGIGPAKLAELEGLVIP